VEPLTAVRMELALYGAKAPGGIRDRDGVPVGAVVQAYAEPDVPTDEAQAAWVRVRLFSSDVEVFVPITGAYGIYRAGPSRVMASVDFHIDDLVEERLAYPLDLIETAPPCIDVEEQADGPPRRSAEALIYGHYFPALVEATMERPPVEDPNRNVTP
jgi:hypothetical protein